MKQFHRLMRSNQTQALCRAWHCTPGHPGVRAHLDPDASAACEPPGLRGGLPGSVTLGKPQKVLSLEHHGVRKEATSSHCSPAPGALFPHHHFFCNVSMGLAVAGAGWPGPSHRLPRSGPTGGQRAGTAGTGWTHTTACHTGRVCAELPQLY